MKNSEKSIDNNYKDFNITEMNTILTFDIIDIKTRIFILKDGRLLVYGHKRNKFKSIVYNLKSNNYINMNIEKINGIIQMDDGTVIISKETNKLLLVDIKEKDFQIIQELEIEFKGTIYLGKLSPKKIIIVESRRNIAIYKYENKQLAKKKEINSAKKFQYIEGMSVISEKEIALDYIQNSLFSSSYNIGFIDLEKDNKIQSYKTGELKILCLINKDLFVYGEENKLYPIHLNNHSKKKEFILTNDGRINSIISLNEKKFLVVQDDYCNQFEVGIDNKIKINNIIKLRIQLILKYPNNMLLIKVHKKRNQKDEGDYMIAGEGELK